jgi:hypothetical protein
MAKRVGINDVAATTASHILSQVEGKRVSHASLPLIGAPRSAYTCPYSPASAQTSYAIRISAHGINAAP